MAGILLFIPEFLLSWFLNSGHEYKWGSPSIYIFVSSCLISIWNMELHLYSRKWLGAKIYPNSTSFSEMTDIFPREQFSEKVRPFHFFFKI